MDKLLTPTTVEDIDYVSPRLRQADYNECLASTGQKPRGILHKGLTHGDISLTLRAPNGDRVGLCGVVPCPDFYELSSHGRLRNVKTGDVTSGFYYDGASGPTYYAALKNCGYIDLHVAAKLIPKAVYLKPYILLAINAMMSGKTPAHLASTADIQESTAWSYFRQAGPYIPNNKLKEIGESIVIRGLWRFLIQMRQNDDDRLDGKLNELMQVVDSTL